MKIAIVELDKVVNIAEVDPGDVPDFLEGFPEVTSGVSIGWLYTAGVFSPPPAQIVDVVEHRAGMQCSRMQGIMALGPVQWALVNAYKSEALTTFNQKIIIDESTVWLRNSQNVAFFAYLLGLDDTQVDALFETAMNILA